MTGRYLLDTNVAIRVLNREIDLGRHRGPVILATGDRHFDRIEDLRTEDW